MLAISITKNFGYNLSLDFAPTGRGEKEAAQLVTRWVRELTQQALSEARSAVSVESGDLLRSLHESVTEAPGGVVGAVRSDVPYAGVENARGSGFITRAAVAVRSRAASLTKRVSYEIQVKVRIFNSEIEQKVRVPLQVRGRDVLKVEDQNDAVIITGNTVPYVIEPSRQQVLRG